MVMSHERHFFLYLARLSRSSLTRVKPIHLMGVESTPAFFLFPVRMDENYNLLPHGVNFQDAIFPDTQENRRMFSSLFQFSNCSQGQQLATFSSDWEIQEDNRVRVGCTPCSSKMLE